MSSLTVALVIITLELMLISLLALMFGERLRKRMFSRRNHQKTFSLEKEDRTPDVALGLLALHERLAQPITPHNDQDPRPAAQQAALQSIDRAVLAMSKVGVCDSQLAEELLDSCDKLAAALETLPVVRETITIEAAPAKEDEPRRESILKSILLEEEEKGGDRGQEGAEQEPAVEKNSDPLNFAMQNTEGDSMK